MCEGISGYDAWKLMSRFDEEEVWDRLEEKERRKEERADEENDRDKIGDW